jgi:catechol 2,3-dioxygenase-like lactoylglutathione lyase family enzyme
MIEGLSHITLVVADLDRSEAMLVAVFGACKVYDSGDTSFSLSRERFFTIGPGDSLWLAIMQGESLAQRSYNHIAFKIDEAEFDAYCARVSAAGLEMRPPRPRVEGEGRSLYFYDADNHLFELHTGTLPERLRRYGMG